MLLIFLKLEKEQIEKYTITTYKLCQERAKNHGKRLRQYKPGSDKKPRLTEAKGTDQSVRCLCYTRLYFWNPCLCSSSNSSSGKSTERDWTYIRCTQIAESGLKEQRTLSRKTNSSWTSRARRMHGCKYWAALSVFISSRLLCCACSQHFVFARGWK